MRRILVSALFVILAGCTALGQQKPATPEDSLRYGQAVLTGTYTTLGNAAATGHRSLRSNLQPSSVMKPSGGRIGMVAIIGSKGASEASMTDRTGISCCSKADGGGAKRSRR